MSYIEPIDRALEILRARGHVVATNPGAYKGPDDEVLVTIDGQLHTYKQIYEMVAAPTIAFDDLNFERVVGGTETTVRCKRCGREMNSADTAAHVCGGEEIVERNSA